MGNPRSAMSSAAEAEGRLELAAPAALVERLHTFQEVRAHPGVPANDARAVDGRAGRRAIGCDDTTFAHDGLVVALEFDADDQVRVLVVSRVVHEREVPRLDRGMLREQR